MDAALPSDALVDRLAALPLFASIPRHELEWLAAQGAVETYEANTVFRDAATPLEEMVIILAGRAALRVDTGTGERRKILEAGPGAILGRLPYSRLHRAPGTTVIEEEMTAFLLHERHFPLLTRDYPELTAALVHHMIDRARDYRSVQLNDDRLQSLSRLASGFAHELNNPASAAARTAQSLVRLIDEEERAARDLAAARLCDAHLALVDAARSECGGRAVPRTALEAADREDDISEWLVRRGLDTAGADALAASTVTIASLDRLAEALPLPLLGVATRWIASGCAARAASREIEAATGRIHDLVGAVKGFTFMDREGVPEAVDIARGLADTLTMLEGKARAKSVTVQVETAPALPPVSGYGSELNQVWEKLLDNALDAVTDRGTVTVTASLRGEAILVRIADDGPGIPEAIRGRIFDPFFTTKPVGRGTGLGLDLARRLVQVHHGEIDFTTEPGRTVFRVRLPIDRRS